MAVKLLALPDNVKTTLVKLGALKEVNFYRLSL